MSKISFYFKIEFTFTPKNFSISFTNKIKNQHVDKGEKLLLFIIIFLKNTYLPKNTFYKPFTHVDVNTLMFLIVITSKKNSNPSTGDSGGGSVLRINVREDIVKINEDFCRLKFFQSLFFCE